MEAIACQSEPLLERSHLYLNAPSPSGSELSSLATSTSPTFGVPSISKLAELLSTGGALIRPANRLALVFASKPTVSTSVAPVKFTRSAPTPRKAPVKSALERSAKLRSAPARLAYLKSASSSEASRKEVYLRFAPAKTEPEASTPLRIAPDRFEPLRKTVRRDAPSRSAF